MDNCEKMLHSIFSTNSMLLLLKGSNIELLTNFCLRIEVKIKIPLRGVLRLCDTD